MSEPRRDPVEPTCARTHAPGGRSAAVIAFRRRDASAIDARLPRDSQPETPAPRVAPRVDHNAGSLAAPAPRATVAVAAVLAVLCAIAGVIVALSLGGALARDTATTQARDVDIPAWHLGWGAVPRTHPQPAQRQRAEQKPATPAVTTAIGVADVIVRDVPRTPRNKRKPIITKHATDDGFVRVVNDSREQR